MKELAYQFEQWKSALENFQKNVEKDLEEIRSCKSDVQQMRTDIFERLDSGQYIRDDSRLILSAPEIIIGNVDKSGVLKDGAASTVLIRSNEIALEGVGDNTTTGGSVITRAANIHSIAEDPGRDGLEHVVLSTSEIISQAKSIVLHSEEATDTFPTDVCSRGNGIHLKSENVIEINATCSNTNKKQLLSDRQKGLETVAKDLKSKANDIKSQMNSLIKEMDKLIDKDTMSNSILSARLNYLDIDELHEEFNSLSESLYTVMTEYFQTLSEWAETNRQADSLKEQAKTVDQAKSKFKENTTYTQIELRSERIDALSIDGDGNFRENPEAGVSINARQIDLQTRKDDGSLHDKSEINLVSAQVEISTANPKIEEKQSDYPATGDVRIVSKNITMEAVDYELKDDKIQEKALTKEGTISLRAETINGSTHDTEGKATGSIALNAKSVAIKSMDIDKEKQTDKSLTSGSTLLLLSEKVYAGAKDSKTRSKQMQIASDQVGVYADTTLELQQDSGKGIVQLAGGNAAVSGSKLNLYGETTMQSKTTFKADITGSDLEVKNLKVNTSFKTPYTTEGVSVPGAPSTAKLSAKLKEEELKESTK